MEKYGKVEYALIVIMIIGLTRDTQRITAIVGSKYIGGFTNEFELG